MKYSRKRSARKGKSQPWYLQKYNALQLAQKAVQGVNYLKGMINSEKYYFDVTQTNQGIDYNGVMYPLSQVAQGDDVNGRSGNSILARSLYFQLEGYKNGTAGNSFIRVIIFFDKQNTGSTPTAGDLLSLVGAATAPVSPLNVDTTTRYQILYDYRKPLDANNTFIMFKKYLKIYKHIRYTGSSGSNTYTNNLYVLCISNEASLTPTVSFTSRLGYHEN